MKSLQGELVTDKQGRTGYVVNHYGGESYGYVSFNGRTESTEVKTLTKLSPGLYEKWGGDSYKAADSDGLLSEPEVLKAVVALREGCKPLSPLLPTGWLTAADYEAELVALAAEHPGATAGTGSSSSYVTVVLGPFTLEDTNGRQHEMGRFECTLTTFYRKTETGYDLEAEALEPNCAVENEEFSHPHVDGSNVCLGEGRDAVDGAVREGRLLDALDIIKGVLSTYSSDSPYFALEDWDGFECGNCGGNSSYEPDTCPACSQDVCGECDRVMCPTSYANLHKACLKQCKTCPRLISPTHLLMGDLAGICRLCAPTCYDCGKNKLRAELVAGRCQKCREPKVSIKKGAVAAPSRDDRGRFATKSGARSRC